MNLNLDLLPLDENGKQRLQEWTAYDLTRLMESTQKLISLSLEGDRFGKSAYYLYEAQFKLVQASLVHRHAISAYLYHMALENEHQRAAEVLGLTYLDYVPLLLYSADEMLANGLQELFELKTDQKTQSGDGEKSNTDKEGSLNRIRKIFRAQQPKYPMMASKIEDFYRDDDRKKIRLYRNHWVHNGPQQIKSEFLRFPHPIRQPNHKGTRNLAESKEGAWILTVQEYFEFDYTFQDFAELLSKGISRTAEFATQCFDEWESEYASSKPQSD